MFYRFDDRGVERRPVTTPLYPGMSAGQRGERGESVAGLSVLYQLHEMVCAETQEEHFVALGHSIRVHLVEDGGADVLILDSKRDAELDREAAEYCDNDATREVVLTLITRILTIDRFDNIEVTFQRNVPSVEASLELLDGLATLLVEQVFVRERDSDSGEETDASGDADSSENFGRGVHRVSPFVVMVVLLAALLAREHTFLFGMGFFHMAIADALTKDDTHQ